VAERTVIQAIRDAMASEMARDDRVIVLGMDVGKRGGVFRATEGLQAQFGDLRVIDTPISESAIVGAAIGASLRGLRPIVEIQFADFIHAAMDQIVNEAARFRYRSRGDWTCPLVIRAPWGPGIHGGLYHSQSVEAFYCHVPGVKVVTPSTPEDAAGLLRASIRDPDPVIFLEHKRTYRAIKGDVPEGEIVTPLGRAAIRREGNDITLLSWGMMAHDAVAAAERLARESIQAEVIDLRTLSPLDADVVMASVRKTGRALVIHEDTLTGGFGAEIAARIADDAFAYLDAPVRRLTAPDVPAMPFDDSMEAFCLPNATKIAEAARALVRF
jgi:2-oxoisovalerate dehydrogenase E1 component beta subunit